VNIRNALLAGTAAVAITTFAGAALAQVQTPGFFGSLEGWYILDSGNDKIYSEPSHIGAAPDDGWGGKAYLGYAFGSFDIAVGGQASDLSKDHKNGPAGRKTTVEGDVWAVDGEVGYTFRWTQTALRLHIGARYAQFDHKRDWEWGGPDAKNTQEWEGVGPRVGWDFASNLGGRFGMFGGGAVAYLFGDIDSKYKPNAGPDIKRKYNADVLNTEAKLGLSYEVAPLVNIAAGYRMQMWKDVAHGNGSLNNGGRGGDVDRLMHGPFVRLSYNIGAPRATPVAAIAAPAPAPAAAPKKNFLVFFDFDRSNITADAQKVITEAATAAKAGNVSRIQLTGHTDRSGSDQYNMALSLRRGEAVKQALIRQGIPAASIAVIGRGESQPLVPTADGVREPQNRRVEILL